MEGDTLEVRCAISEQMENIPNELYMYLCKNGSGIIIERLGESKEINFKVSEVAQNDSGDYSCVFSPQICSVSEVIAEGTNSIFIHVKGNAVIGKVPVFKKYIVLQQNPE